MGDVQGSQVVIGDHTTVQTSAGTKVTVLQVGERPVPRLRPLPISRRPSAVEALGREEELELIAAARAGGPVQLYAPDGAGKTSLLKFAALRTLPPAEGVVFESARHRSLDEIQAGLYAAFWECDIPFIPAPSQFNDFLADREALLILDDCALDRDELESLLERLPRCTVVLASQERTLWSPGTAQRLADLDPVAAIGLLERELGRSLDPDEREAAEAIVARLGGNPQALVETAALIEDGRSSLRELADDPAALERRFDPSALTDSQRRILVVLSALDGAALGVEHVAAVARVDEAGEALRDLERRGWAKAGSPRYRSTRPLPPDAVESSPGEIAKPLLGHLTAWSGKAKPRAVADEAEAIERALELGAAAERWEETLALALAAERGLTVAGAWSSCRRVLRIGLRAATQVGRKSTAAYVLHQLGSQSLCLGNRAEAAEQLTEALQIREYLGEQKAAELTRHNLRQLEGGGDGGDTGDRGGDGPPRPRMAIALTVLAVVAGLVGALVLAGGDDRNVANPGSRTSPTDSITTPDLPVGADPAIEIYGPEEGATLEVGDELNASFDCFPAEDAEIDSCEGLVDGARVSNGDPLDMSAGDHKLVVTAVDDKGHESTGEASYSVSDSGHPTPVDKDPPEISIVSPADERQYVLGESVRAEYNCTDDGSGVATCSGDLEKGASINTKIEGTAEFTVTAIDSAGNKTTETVHYEVVAPEEVVSPDEVAPSDGAVPPEEEQIPPEEEGTDGA